MDASTREFSKQVLQRLHGMARVKICKSNRCEICKGLPSETPERPTEDTNILLRMRADRLRQTTMPEALPPVVPKPVPVIRTPVEQPRPVCKVPPVEGMSWAAVGNLISHAYTGGDSLCGKWPRKKADFNRLAYNYCRFCQVEALKLQGIKAYLIGERVCVRTAEGIRRLK